MAGRWFGRGYLEAFETVIGRFVTVSMASSFNATWLSSSPEETERSWSLGWPVGFGKSSDRNRNFCLIFFPLYFALQLGQSVLASSWVFWSCIFWNLGGKTLFACPCIKYMSWKACLLSIITIYMYLFVDEL